MTQSTVVAPDLSPMSPRSQFSNDSDLTVVTPDLISKFEINFSYNGISGNPPKLMWRSDRETNPFPIPAPGVWYYREDANSPEKMWHSDLETNPNIPIPAPGGRFFNIPTKTAHGVFGTPLNAVWDTVAPQILASMKAHHLKYSALKTVRFSTIEDGKKETFGPVVVWIAVRPNTTNAGAVRDATPDILHILADAQITDVVVEWYEGSVKRLAGPPLMSVEDTTFGLNHPFNAGLGIPIARQSDGSQGTLAFLFREIKASNGDPSNRILAVTNKHVASVDARTHYQFDGTNPQHILVCGERRLASAIAEIEGAIKTGLEDADSLATELADLKLKSDEQNSMALQRTQSALDVKKDDNATLQMLLAEVKAEWQDTNGRRFGIVDWAPEISVRVDDRHYTRNIATFAVDGAKLENFEGNIVDLGNQYSAGELKRLFWPNPAVSKDRTIPADLQLPIRRALPRRLVLNPETVGENGEPLYIVAKYGNTTKLTLGRYSSMEAYTCTHLGLESMEVAVYNYDNKSGDFSLPGDSGSLIFTGDGDGLAILHSGMPLPGPTSHVTYCTPLWWVIKQILGKYPSAEFYGIMYALD